MSFRSGVIRPALVAAAVAVSAAIARPDTPAKPDLSGTWLLSYITQGGTAEAHLCVVKVGSKDGKPTAEVVAAPAAGKQAPPKVTGVAVAGKVVTLSMGNGMAFTGTLGDDPKVVRGGFGNQQFQYRGVLARTDKAEIDEPVTRTPVEAMTKAQQLAGKSFPLRMEAAREKDAEKKKELLAKIEDVQKEVDEKMPALYREVVEKSPDHPAALDAAQNLIAGAAKSKMTADEARKLAAVVAKQAAPYGPAYTRFALPGVAETLAARKDLAPVAVDLLEPVAAGLAETDPPATQVRVLAAYQTALAAAGRAAELKPVEARLTALEAKLDDEYVKTVPPFKPAAFAGRADKAANRVAVLELFTGAQCPPCVAADVAFDALTRAYKPTDLVLIQYHLHIPGPDPLTTAESVARSEYYEVRGTPSTFFNGKDDAGGGGGMTAAESKFKQYARAIDPILEKTTDVKVGGRADRTGDTVAITVDVTGAAGDDVTLRLLVVEESIKYVGGNQLRFHHQVVRAMPLGAKGVPVKDGALKQTATVDLGGVRKALTEYLDDYAKNTRPFPKAARPMDLKDLKVVALVQNDKTKEILQAAQFEIEGK